MKINIYKCGNCGNYWRVNITLTSEKKFYKLSKAKAFAVENGASGKWNRTVKNTGPRRGEVIVYTDAGAIP